MAETTSHEPAAPAMTTPPPVQQPAAPTSTTHHAPAPASYPYAQPSFYAQPQILPFNKTSYWVKIVLTVASIIFCLILLGLSVACSTGPGYDLWNITIYWVAPLIAGAGFWSLAELITLCACGKRNNAEFRRGIHPGAHVGVDLIVWLAGIVCLFFTALAYVGARSQLETCQEEANSDSSNYRYYYYDYCDDDEITMLSNGFYLPATQAIMAFIALLT
jgi:hypothetical protein